MSGLTSDLQWLALQLWLEKPGYMLPPRFHPGWTPPWNDSDDAIFHAETQTFLGLKMFMTKMSDNTLVILKCLDPRKFSEEAKITTFFSSSPLASDPRNHCVPVYDILNVPDILEDHGLLMLVMPVLVALGCTIYALTSGSSSRLFLMLMDAHDMFPEPWHPLSPLFTLDMQPVEPTTRTQNPPKYYLIDFGISRQYDSSIEHPLEEVWMAGDKTAPEHHSVDPEPCDPFPTDVYLLGNLIRRHFIGVKPIRDHSPGGFVTMPPWDSINDYQGFDFIVPLVKEMVDNDPDQRPTIDEVVDDFEKVIIGMTTWKLRSRVVLARDHGLFSRYSWLAHWFRRGQFMWHGIPAIPDSTVDSSKVKIYELKEGFKALRTVVSSTTIVLPILILAFKVTKASRPPA